MASREDQRGPDGRRSDQPGQPGQPRGRRGTVGHPYSALNLRMVLALFGLAVSATSAILLVQIDAPVPAAVMAALALAAVIDLVVVIRRRQERRRRDPDRRYSLFE